MNEPDETRPGPVGPSVEPTVDSSFSNGWSRLWGNFLELLLIVVIMFVAYLPVSWSTVSEYIGVYEGFFLKIFAFVYLVMILAPLRYGADYVYLRAARGEKADVKYISESFQNYLNAVLASILAWAIIGFGIFFFIVPGIIFACKLAFVPYLIVDRKMDAVGAIKKSWNMTSGHAASIFLIYLLAIPIGIAGLLCLAIGIIPAVMWIRTSLASMYFAVCLLEEKRGGDEG